MEIRWVQMANGRWIPVDPEPNPAGHVIVLDDGQRAVPMSDEWRLVVLADENHPATPRVFLDHRETCGRVGMSPALPERSKRWARREKMREVKLEAEARYEARTRRRINPLVRARVLDRDGHKCVLCGATEDLTLDHIFPHIEGGSDDPVNLRVLCRSCNSSKGASIPDVIRLIGREG